MSHCNLAARTTFICSGRGTIKHCENIIKKNNFKVALVHRCTYLILTPSWSLHMDILLRSVRCPTPHHSSFTITLQPIGNFLVTFSLFPNECMYQLIPGACLLNYFTLCKWGSSWTPLMPAHFQTSHIQNSPHTSLVWPVCRDGSLVNGWQRLV